MKVRVLDEFFDVTAMKVYDVISGPDSFGEVDIIDDVGDRFTLFDEEYETVNE